MNKIPSDEEFARASRTMKEEFRNLSQITENIKRRFGKKCPLHRFSILPQQERCFRAYVFFEKDGDIANCEASGISRELRDAVYDELESAGRGKRDAISVIFEFDSHESVTRDYGGDYFTRLH